jgi:hypothetical protein
LERRVVSKEELEREQKELEELRRSYEAKWRRLRAIVARIRFWETQIATLESRLTELRRIGWPRLRAPERSEWLRIRDLLLPRARAYRLAWDTERLTIIPEIRTQREAIRKLEAEIARKIVIIKQMVHVKIVIFSIVKGPAHRPYIRRFQTVYNVTAIRDVETGEIDLTDELTRKQLEAVTADFYMRWAWSTLPSGASPPEIALTSEWEVIDEPEDATIKEMSVREDEEETYRYRFIPPEVVYSVSDEEKKAMLKRIEEMMKR